MSDVPDPLDSTDQTLIRLMRLHPRISTIELSPRAGIARNTVTMRLTRLIDRGVIVGHGPDIDRRAADYQVLAFVTLTIAQGAHEETVDSQRPIANVLEIHTVTGRGDLLRKVIAETTDNLHRTVQEIASTQSVHRTDTQLALETSTYRTAADLIARTPSPDPDSDRPTPQPPT